MLPQGLANVPEALKKTLELATSRALPNEDEEEEEIDDDEENETLKIDVKVEV